SLSKAIISRKKTSSQAQGLQVQNICDCEINCKRIRGLRKHEAKENRRCKIKKRMARTTS
ncbi:11139_t:CDS:1, partial [Dentiscutata heterogama]